MQTNLYYGCTLASWVDGRYVHPDMTFQGNAGAGWVTIASDEYDVHSSLGTISQRMYDNDDNAVDWDAYRDYQDLGNTAFRCTYSVYNPSTNTATAYTNEAQTVNYLTFGPAAANPITGRLTQTTEPFGQFLVGDYLSLGTVGTRPTDKNTGTGIWGDATGLYGLNASTQEVVFSAATGKITAGAGEVTLDSNGVSLTSGAGDTNQVKWYSGATKIMSVMTSANDATFGSYGRFYVYNSPSVAKASLFFAVGEVDTGPITQLTLISTTAGDRYAAFHSNGTTFQGLAVTNATRFSPSSLLHLKAPAPTFRMEDTTASAKDLLVTTDANATVFQEATAATDILRLDLANKNVVVNSAALATNATDGFLYITSSAGAPSGTPTTFTGRYPIHIDSTNHNLYFYDGSWRTAIGAAGAPVGSAFVTIGTDATLTSERSLTGTSNQITVTDNGAGSTVVLSTPQNIHTAATPTFQSLTLSHTAPQLNLTDTTASAKSLQIIVDANIATFEEAGGTDMMVFDLTNARVGIGTASPTSGYKLELSDSVLVNSSTNNTGFNVIFTGASSASVGPQNSFTTNDGAAVVNQDRIGSFLFSGFDGTANVLSAAIIARATETWATTTNRGSQIDFLATPNGSVTIATPMILSATTLTLANAVNIAVNTSTGTKIGTGTTQKLGFWNATPIVQPTTSYGAASFTANAGTAVNDASTFDGYTLKQVVSALRGTGLLA